MSTAAERVGALFEELATQPEIRAIDLTRRRRLAGSQLSRGYQRARSNLSLAGLTHETPTLFAIRPSSRALTHLCAMVNLGVPVVLTDLRLPLEVIRSQVHRVSVSTLITEPFSALLATRPLCRLLHGHVEIPPLHDLAPRVLTTRRRWPGKTSTRQPKSSDPALIVFTSGTTDEPKGVIHTQDGLAEMIGTLEKLIGDIPGAVVYSDMFHSLLPALAAGARCVIGSQQATDSDLASALDRYEVEVWFTAPGRAGRVIPLMGEQAPQHVILGSAPVTASLVEHLKHHSPSTRVTAVYGMTEAVPIAIADGAEILEHGGPGDLVGRIVEGVDVAIDDGDEIWIHGPRVGHYFDGQPGWIATGDLGRWDGQGRLILDGRSKDMILADSRNIYPQHFEPAVKALDGVIDSALVGVQEQHGDESVWLVVELDGERDTVTQRLQSLPEIETLGIRGVVFAPLPKGRQGKLDRKACRSIIQDARTHGTVTPFLTR